MLLSRVAVPLASLAQACMHPELAIGMVRPLNVQAQAVRWANSSTTVSLVMTVYLQAAKCPIACWGRLGIKHLQMREQGQREGMNQVREIKTYRWQI